MPNVCARNSIAAAIPAILLIQRWRFVGLGCTSSSRTVVALSDLARINLSAFIAPVKVSLPRACYFQSKKSRAQMKWPTPAARAAAASIS
jgi:hypothetical protein